MSEAKRLYRSRKDKVIAGVCGGIGEYFNIDPVWIRLIFVLLVLLQGTGILVYIIAWVLVPENPEQTKTKKTKAENAVEKVINKVDKRSRDDDRGKVAIIIGAFLVLLGLAFLFKNIFTWFSFNYVWPIMIILLGIYLISRREK